MRRAAPRRAASDHWTRSVCDAQLRERRDAGRVDRRVGIRASDRPDDDRRGQTPSSSSCATIANPRSCRDLDVDAARGRAVAIPRRCRHAEPSTPSSPAHRPSRMHPLRRRVDICTAGHASTSLADAAAIDERDDIDDRNRATLDHGYFVVDDRRRTRRARVDRSSDSTDDVRERSRRRRSGAAPRIVAWSSRRAAHDDTVGRVGVRGGRVDSLIHSHVVSRWHDVAPTTSACLTRRELVRSRVTSDPGQQCASFDGDRRATRRRAWFGRSVATAIRGTATAVRRVELTGATPHGWSRPSTTHRNALGGGIVTRHARAARRHAEPSNVGCV